MALVLANDTVERFNNVTRFNLSDYLSLWVNFLDSNYQNLIDYYKGSTNDLKQETTNALNVLVKQRDILDDVLVNNSESFDRFDFWNLLEYLDDISGRISYIQKVSKFLRSAKYDGFNENSLAIEHSMTDYDTPDSIADKERENPQDEWVDIFTKNQKLETDYRAEQGGLLLTIGDRESKNLFLNTVIDNLFGDNLYGKDMDKEFLFDNNDLKVLTPRDTFKQSMGVLGEVAKGDIPEYPEMGISKEATIGTNLGLVSVPFVLRELKQTFATDDTMINFSVLDVKVEESAMFIEYEVESFKNLTTQNKIQI